MEIWEKLGVFDYQPGKSEGNFICILAMNPVLHGVEVSIKGGYWQLIASYCSLNCYLLRL